MSIGAFTDKQHPPAEQEILLAIGEARQAWEGLEQYIASNFRVKKDLGFYGKNYGWAVRFRKGGKALLSLYPRQGGFTVQVVLSEPLVQQILLEDIGENTRRAIKAANVYAEGRWLFIQVASQKDVEDIRRLLQLKASPQVR